MNTTLVVFDMAGTTISDSGNINQCFRNAFSSEGLQVSAADVDTVMGYRKIEAVEIIVKKYAIVQEAELAGMVERIHGRFNREMVLFYQNDPNLKPLPFAVELFGLLNNAGIKVALNTGFTRDIADTILQRLYWKQHPCIHAVVCSNEVPEGRPHPYMIREIMRQLDLPDIHTVVKVGDTEVDVQEGRNAGCGKVVAVTTGAYTRAQLAQYQPDHIIDSLQQLPAVIELPCA